MLVLCFKRFILRSRVVLGGGGFIQRLVYQQKSEEEKKTKHVFGELKVVSRL